MSKETRPDDSGERDTMIVYRTFYESIRELPKVNQAEVWEAVFELGLNFNEIPLKGLSQTVFRLMAPIIRKNIAQYKNGSRSKDKPMQEKRQAKDYENGGQLEAKPKPNRSQTEAYKDKDKDKDKDNDISSKEVVSVRDSFSGFDACKASREFEEIYKKAGRRSAIEREYSLALQKIKAQYGYDHEKGHESIKTSAAAYMMFTVKTGTELRYIPNPENWLSDRMYETNWFEKAREATKESTTEPKSKPLIGLSKVEELDRQREERHRKQAEEAQNGN